MSYKLLYTLAGALLVLCCSINELLDFFSIFLFIFQDIAGTLASEGAEDAAQVAKLRSALESVDHKRRKVVIFICLHICEAFIMYISCT